MIGCEGSERVGRMPEACFPTGTSQIPHQIQNRVKRGLARQSGAPAIGKVISQHDGIYKARCHSSLTTRQLFALQHNRGLSGF